MALWIAQRRQHKTKEYGSHESPAVEEVVDTVNPGSAVQTPLQPNWQNIIRIRKRDRDLGYEHFQDLRQEYPPIDPRQQDSRYEELRRNPRSPPSTLICKFQPKEPTDVRIRRWEWWAALSHIKIYVREYYM